MTQTQHTDEPSVDELLKWCDEIVSPFTTRHMDIKAVHAVARALRFRLSHPTLSAERKEWSVDDLTHFLRDWFASHETDEGVALDPEIIADAILYEADTYRTKAPTLSADRNAVIEDIAKIIEGMDEKFGSDIAEYFAKIIRSIKQ